MSDRDTEIDKIMKHPLDAVIRCILHNMDGWRVSHIRQSLAPSWRDGFHQNLFDMWYRDKDVDSPAREYFTHLKQVMKHYPEQGWGGPAETAEVGLWTCNVCGMIITDDEILLDHFRNGNCVVFNQMVTDSDSPTNFWIKMKEKRNK